MSGLIAWVKGIPVAGWAPWVGLLLLVSAVVRLSVPTLSGWYHDDDFHNLRWVLEYRYEPWAALIERHALHDHVRPMTLMSFWLGAVISDGAYWGPQGLLVVLNILGMAGTVVLARQLSGSWRAGILAGLLVVSAWGWLRIMDWISWTNSAGEACLGVWAIVAAHRALQQRAFLPVVVVGVILSGLYKEPGSFIYPCAIAAMGWTALRGGRRDAAVVALLAMVPVGLAVFAFTWHGANVTRMGDDAASSVSLPLQILSAFHDLTLTLVNVWPGSGSAGGRLGSGVPILLLLGVLLYDLIGRERLVRDPRLQDAWLAGTVLLSGASMLHPSVAGYGIPLLGLLVLVRCGSAPPIGLVMYFCAVGVMSPFLQTNEATVLGAVHGLALYAAVGVSAVFAALHAREPAPAPRSRAAVYGLFPAAVAVLSGLLLFGRLLLPDDASGQDNSHQRKHTMLAYSALARTLDMHNTMAIGMNLIEQEGLPLLGIAENTSQGFIRPILSVDGRMLFDPPPGSFETHIVQKNLLNNARLSSLRPPQGGHSAGDSGTRLSLEPGYYVLATPGTNGNAALAARDACGHFWSTQQGTMNAFWNLTPLYLAPGCAPLEVGWFSWAGPMALLAPLREPDLSVWHPVEITRRTVRSSLPPGPGTPSALR